MVLLEHPRSISQAATSTQTKCLTPLGEGFASLEVMSSSDSAGYTAIGPLTLEAMAIVVGGCQSPQPESYLWIATSTPIRHIAQQACMFKQASPCMRAESTLTPPVPVAAAFR
jgi:hypothetical protein